MPRTRHPRPRPSSRTQPPPDWLRYLERVAAELPVALEILRRLRWAHALSRRGFKTAPLPAGRYRPPSRPGWAKVPQPEWLITSEREPDQVEAALLTPEEMVATLTADEIKQLLDEWEAEVTQWGLAIWERRGDTLRLRQQRTELLDAIDRTRLFDPSIGEAEAIRLDHQAAAEPGKQHRSRSGATFALGIQLVDEFGNDIDGPLDADTLEQLAAKPEDERSLRRRRRGDLKKSRGGVSDVDPRLVHKKAR
jgi:hypothetical protein